MSRFTRRSVEVLNDDGTTTTFESVNGGVKALGKCNDQQIHLMIATGKARFVEEKYYDTLEPPEKEKNYDAVEPSKNDRPPKEFYKIISLMAKQHLRTL